MRAGRNSFSILAATLAAVVSLSTQVRAQTRPDAIGLAEKQISALLSQLADVHCIETVVQEKLAENGHVMSSEREQFDYLIMLDAHEDDFQLSESRIETAGLRRTHVSTPMMLTNGMATILLVFHPYYRDSFTFELEPEQMQGGKPTIPIHFTHISGRRTPAVLALHEREYPLDLQGTAWLDRNDGTVVRVEASLLHDMTDVGLRALSIQVEYKPVQLGASAHPYMLPASAVVDVMTPHQHWRNTHFFGNYHTFSAEAEEGQGAKIHGGEVAPDAVPKPALPQADPKEKP